MKLCLRCNQYFEDSVEQCPTDQTWLESVGKDPLIGALINNRYLVDSVIGKGSSGIVYRASRMGRGEMVVAIKVLHSFIGAAGSALDRFLREVQAASSLKNPHIIRIWEWGVTDDGQPYFVMDYLEGVTLGRLIREKGQIEPKRVLSIIHQTCDALIEAHRLGITHRDLKPENIVLQESGQGDDYIKLLDFGIADSPQHAMLAYKLEKPRTVSGSPAYMSPEQCQGFELDGRSDIYSLAIVVFEMLTGTRPFRQSEDVNVMVLHVSEAPMTLLEARPDLSFPVSIEYVLARALSKLPSQRQGTIQDFYNDLEQAFQGLDMTKQIITGDKGSAVSTLNRLQAVAKTEGLQTPSANSGTVETEVARAASNFASQPSVLGPPAARMSSSRTDLPALAPQEKLIQDPGETREEGTITGTTTVQRLMQAVEKGKSFTETKMAALNNQSIPNRPGHLVNNSLAEQNNTPPVSPSKQKTTVPEMEDTKGHYLTQRQSTTLSRLEGWKKTGGQTRQTIVTTRAKAAAMKAATARKPINFFNLLLAVTTTLCLGTSIYLIYTALTTQLPRPISVEYLSKIGNYEQVKSILEQKQITGRLTNTERNQLAQAYFNLAKISMGRKEIDQALSLLSHIDPQATIAPQGKKLKEKLLKEEERGQSDR